MQTLIQTVCSKGTSLRDAIVNDSRLAAFGLEVSRKQTPGRSHGWAKLHSQAEGRRGVLNLEWDQDTSILVCRIVNRGRGRPDRIAGDFIAYLLTRYRRRIDAINIVPR